MKQSQHIPDGWGFDKWVRPAKANQSPKRIKFFVFAVMACLLFLGVNSCKAPKDVSSYSKEKEDKKTEKDLEVEFDTKLNEAVGKVFENALRKKLNIHVQQTIYDSNKPVDPNTGKPPVKEENNVNLSEETEEQTNEQTNIETSETGSAKIRDKGKEHTKLENEQKGEEKAALNWWQKLTSGIIVFGLALWLIIWGIKKLLKWKLKP